MSVPLRFTDPSYITYEKKNVPVSCGAYFTSLIRGPSQTSQTSFLCTEVDETGNGRLHFGTLSNGVPSVDRSRVAFAAPVSLQKFGSVRCGDWWSNSSSHHALLGGEEGSLVLLKLEPSSGSAVKVLPAVVSSVRSDKYGSGAVNNVCVGMNGETALVSTTDGSLFQLGIRDGALVLEKSYRHPLGVDSGVRLAYSAACWKPGRAEQLVAVGTSSNDVTEGSLEVIDLRAGSTPVWNVHGTCAVSSVAWCQQGVPTIAAGCCDGYVCLWDTRWNSITPLVSFVGHSSAVEDVLWTKQRPDLFWSSSADMTVNVCSSIAFNHQDGTGHEIMSIGDEGGVKQLTFGDTMCGMMLAPDALSPMIMSRSGDVFLLSLTDACFGELYEATISRYVEPKLGRITKCIYEGEYRKGLRELCSVMRESIAANRFEDAVAAYEGTLSAGPVSMSEGQLNPSNECEFRMALCKEIALRSVAFPKSVLSSTVAEISDLVQEARRLFSNARIHQMTDLDDLSAIMKNEEDIAMALEHDCNAIPLARLQMIVRNLKESDLKSAISFCLRICSSLQKSVSKYSDKVTATLLWEMMTPTILDHAHGDKSSQAAELRTRFLQAPNIPYLLAQLRMLQAVCNVTDGTLTLPSDRPGIVGVLRAIDSSRKEIRESYCPGLNVLSARLTDLYLKASLNICSFDVAWFTSLALSESLEGSHYARTLTQWMSGEGFELLKKIVSTTRSQVGSDNYRKVTSSFVSLLHSGRKLPEALQVFIVETLNGIKLDLEITVDDLANSVSERPVAIKIVEGLQKAVKPVLSRPRREKGDHPGHIFYRALEVLHSRLCE